LMKPIQRIVIRTEILGRAFTENGLLEHSAERHTINDTGLNSKTDDSARVLIQDDKYPNTFVRQPIRIEISRGSTSCLSRDR
jgi:hypothetical protein